MASEIRVTNIKANDGTASLTVANSTGNVSVGGTLTTTGNTSVGGTLTSSGTLTSTGDTTLNNGNLVISTSGKGITFSSTNTPAQSAGTGSHNTLDDYEEGSFNVMGEGGNSGWSSGSPVNVGTGYYVKVGKRVFISVSFSRAGNADGGQWNGSQWVFSGFPFAVNKVSQCAFGLTARTQIHSNATHFWFLNTTGKIYAYCMNANQGGASDVLSQNTGSNFTPNIAFNISYETT